MTYILTRFSTLIVSAIAVLGIMLASVQMASAVSFSPVRYNLQAEPGQSVRGTVTVVNDEDVTQEYFLFVNNFEPGPAEDGSPNFDVPNDHPLGIAPWTTLDRDAVTLAPGEQVVVGFTIRIPEGARLGGRYGAVFFSQDPPEARTGGDDGVGGSVGFGSQFGPLVLLTVGNEHVEDASLTDFAAKRRFLARFPVELIARFENNGTVHMVPTGVIRVNNMFGKEIGSMPFNPGEGSILPGFGRRVTTEFTRRDVPDGMPELLAQIRNGGFGIYRAILDVEYDSNVVPSSTHGTWFLVFPWQLVLVVIVLLALGYYALRGYRRSLIEKYGGKGSGKRK